MPHPHTQKQSLTDEDLIKLQDRAFKTLDHLVTPEGIYASFGHGWSGPYHSWFGRDGAIVTDFLCGALEYGGSAELAIRAHQGLDAFKRWQGKRNDELTGEERGKMPHEIRAKFTTTDEVQHAAGTNKLPWYIDSGDHLLKNWDSVDSTALWIVAMIRAHKYLEKDILADDIALAMRDGLEWLLGTMDRYGGLVGFTGADLQAHREYSGLHNQGWKDSFQVYQNTDGTLATHPIKDVLVNAEAWTALFEASELFASDESFSKRLLTAARTLRERFNRERDGFLLPDKSYFAQAIDGNGKQLSQISIDVGMCLWMGHKGLEVIEPRYIDTVVEMIVSEKMFNPRAGIRDYELGTIFTQGTLYHGSPFTYWPFASILVARGLLKVAREDDAKRVMRATLLAIEQFDSNIEMFIEGPDGELTTWHHPKVGQRSSTEQAWTAAAVYFATLYLLKNR